MSTGHKVKGVGAARQHVWTCGTLQHMHAVHTQEHPPLPTHTHSYPPINQHQQCTHLVILNPAHRF